MLKKTVLTTLLAVFALLPMTEASANPDIAFPLARSLGAPTTTMPLEAPQKAVQARQRTARGYVAQKQGRPSATFYGRSRPYVQRGRANPRQYGGFTIDGGALGPARGQASYYWQGNKTASGEPFKADGISCAHRTLAFGTMLRVTNLSNGRSVTCRVNNRGPFIQGRIVDLSRGAARQIGMLQAGVVPVEISIVR